jgi:hypothetical protein
VRREVLLILLSVAASALFWWPVSIEPNLDLPWWIPLPFIAIVTGLATTLARNHWLGFVIGSATGTFAGLCSGYFIWPPSDGIAASYVPYEVLVGSVAAIVVSLVAGLIALKTSVKIRGRQLALWLPLVACAGFGPLALALTRPLVASRVARNDQLAAERFTALKKAVESTWAETGDPSRICDGQVLKSHYSGPRLSEKDWHYIAGNYVKADGYVFGIYCHEKGGYTIDSFPARQKADGTHRFCADESRSVGCGMSWNRSRYACTPCSK